MDNDRTKVQDNSIENKSELISKKVWDLESNKTKQYNINADGSIPLSLYKEKNLKTNNMYPTDYTETSGSDLLRTFVVKINNEFKKFKLTENA